VLASEEQQLVAASRRGDAEALRRLVDAYYDPLYRFLWRLTASPEEAAELTQEAFVRALERIGSFDGRSRFSTWLHAIGLNVWKDALRRSRRERTEALEQPAATAAMTGTEEGALSGLDRHAVRQALARLPEAQRVAIVLFYYEGLSHQEIAQICRCPAGTVGTRVFHGLRALRRMLCDPLPALAPAASANRRVCDVENGT
jgi:RNA polymerase sigma-70 factor (ECF subfamily)